MEELKKFIETEIRKTEKLLANEEQNRKENICNPLFNNEVSIISIGSALTAYRNVLDKINTQI